jgi:transposase
VTEIREILRRLQLGERARRIARELGVSRNTVAHYRRWAATHGLLTGPLPEPAQLAAWLTVPPAQRPAQEQSLVEPFGDQVLAWHAQGVEGQAIWQLLVEQHGFGGSYSSVKRFLRRVAPPPPRATLRVEVDPGDEAQVDFGFGGLYRDPEADRLRRAWVFVMMLSCSRHQYAELVFDQSLATWLRLHRAAFEFFGGVPRRVVLDNLRAAIVHAALYDPDVQRSYREFAEHYGFLIAPCRPRTPEHKGKVEQGGVHYVKRNALAGRAFRDLHDGNRHLLRWCVETAGRRVDGTTKQSPWRSSTRSSARPCSPCPSPPGSWRSGSRPSSTPTAMSSSPGPTTRHPTGSSASGSGSAPPRGRSSAITSTPSWRHIGARVPASGAPSPPTCRRTRSTSSCKRRPGVAPARPRSAPPAASSSSGCSAIARWIGSVAPRACCA